MKKQISKMLSKLPKKILTLIIFTLILFFCAKIFINTAENAILNIVKSDRFSRFIGNQIELQIINYANSLDDNKDKDYEALQNSLKKIIKKWKPILND